MALLSLRMLLESPNPKDPQDAEVAKMLMEDPEYFKLVAHDWAVKYAGAPRTQIPPEQHQRKVIKQVKQPDDPLKYVEIPSSCPYACDNRAFFRRQRLFLAVDNA